MNQDDVLLICKKVELEPNRFFKSATGEPVVGFRNRNRYSNIEIFESGRCVALKMNLSTGKKDIYMLPEDKESFTIEIEKIKLFLEEIDS